jgi:hypothetical protein
MENHYLNDSLNLATKRIADFEKENELLREAVNHLQPDKQLKELGVLLDRLTECNRLFEKVSDACWSIQDWSGTYLGEILEEIENFTHREN